MRGDLLPMMRLNRLPARLRRQMRVAWLDEGNGYGQVDPDFDDPTPVIAEVRRCRHIEPVESVAASSGDGWNWILVHAFLEVRRKERLAGLRL